MGKKKRHTPEQIIRTLREVEVLVGRGQTVQEVVISYGITEQTFYRWRREYGGFRTGQPKRLKELERENTQLRKALSQAALDRQILQEQLLGK